MKYSGFCFSSSGRESVAQRRQALASGDDFKQGTARRRRMGDPAPFRRSSTSSFVPPAGANFRRTPRGEKEKPNNRLCFLARNSVKIRSGLAAASVMSLRAPSAWQSVIVETSEPGRSAVEIPSIENSLLRHRLAGSKLQEIVRGLCLQAD